MSFLPDSQYVIHIDFDLVELAIEIKLDSGKYGLRATKHDDGRYATKILYSAKTGGIISYQANDKTLNEPILPVILYHQVSSNMVVPGSYVYALLDNILFPTNKGHQSFAVRPKSVDSATILTPNAPKGLAITSPWFMRLEGNSIADVPLSEISDAKYRIEKRKETTKTVNQNQLILSGRNIRVNITDDGHIGGITIYHHGFRDNPLKIIKYNSLHGIVTLAYNVPVGVELTVEYDEIIDWIEYTDIQLNPSLDKYPEMLQDNYVLTYIDKNSLDETKSIYHKLIPKFTKSDAIEYTFADYVQIVSELTSDGIPLSVISVIEPVDEDFFEIHDARTRGGYVGKWKHITDISSWDGEDVDISGVMIAKVPINVQEGLEKSLAKWEGVKHNDLKLAARTRISEVIDRYKRLGSKIINIDFEENE